MSGTAPASATEKVVINGIEFEVLAEANVVPAQDAKKEPTLKKEDRSTLDKEKWVSIRKQMETGLETKLQEISVSEKDLSALTNACELAQQNKLFVQHLEEWDLMTPFVLAQGAPKKNATAGKTECESKKPLEEWPTISISDVAKSNRWCNQHANDRVCPWIRQDMDISHKFLINSCTPDLAKQVTDVLLAHPGSDRGGPLTFRILMNLLQVNSERAIKHLIECVESVDVKNFD